LALIDASGSSYPEQTMEIIKKQQKRKRQTVNNSLNAIDRVYKYDVGQISAPVSSGGNGFILKMGIIGLVLFAILSAVRG
jgi:hypothetical protein